jgi:D-arabinose 1-dehydrogenase-like Zn-dependent alcohol dehydrogenase
VAVLGCGGLGMATIAILHARGVRNIVACDIDAGKLAEAIAYGASASLDTRQPDAVAQLKAITGDNLIGAIDLVGMPETAQLAIAAFRKGGRYVMCGLYGGQITLPMPPLAQRALTIGGSYVGNLQELRELVALAQSGKLRRTPVELRPASEINRSLTELKAGKVLGRVVIDMETAAA